MDPICASAMQCVSYERVYDNITKLGALFDIEIMASNVLKVGVVHELMVQDLLLKVLNTRLEVMLFILLIKRSSSVCTTQNIFKSSIHCLF